MKIDNKDPRRKWKCGCVTHYKTNLKTLCLIHVEILKLKMEIEELERKVKDNPVVGDYYSEVKE